MTRDEKSQVLATYIRQKLHQDASSDHRHNNATKSVEIDIVHPVHGARVVAFSEELLDDNELEEITKLIDEYGIVKSLDEKNYGPLIITNAGLENYQG